MRILKTMPLVVLLIFLIPGNTSGNPFERTNTEDASANPVAKKGAKHPTIEGVLNGTNKISEIIEWASDKLKDTELDRNILLLREAIANLPPGGITIDRQDVLLKVRRSAHRIRTVRETLETAAEVLKEKCQGLIKIYERFELNKPGFLKWSASKLVESAKQILGVLVESKDILKDVYEDLLVASSSLDILEIDLANKQKDVDDLKNKSEDLKFEICQLEKDLAKLKNDSINRQKDADEVGDTIGDIPVAGIGLGTVADLGVLIYKGVDDHKTGQKLDGKRNDLKGKERDLKQNERDIVNLKESINKISNATQKLITNMDEINVYVAEEIQLITDWQYHLNGTIQEHENLSDEDLEFGSILLVGGLERVIKACDAYIDHKLPDILS